MFAEAWRLQREQFWAEDMMSGIDWDAMYAQYAPLLNELFSSELVPTSYGNCKGNLGTSHPTRGRRIQARSNYRQGSWRGLVL